MGLGILASKANRVTDEMFMAAAIALKDGSPALKDPQASLLPRLEDLRQIARQIAIAVGTAAQKQGIAEKTTAAELEKRVDETVWSPEYLPFKRHQA